MLRVFLFGGSGRQGWAGAGQGGGARHLMQRAARADQPQPQQQQQQRSGVCGRMQQRQHWVRVWLGRGAVGVRGQREAGMGRGQGTEG
jgi:hypothetical protein